MAYSGHRVLCACRLSHCLREIFMGKLRRQVPVTGQEPEACQKPRIWTLLLSTGWREGKSEEWEFSGPFVPAGCGSCDITWPYMGNRALTGEVHGNYIASKCIFRHFLCFLVALDKAETSRDTKDEGQCHISACTSKQVCRGLGQGWLPRRLCLQGLVCSLGFIPFFVIWLGTRSSRGTELLILAPGLTDGNYWSPPECQWDVNLMSQVTARMTLMNVASGTEEWVQVPTQGHIRVSQQPMAKSNTA